MAKQQLLLVDSDVKSVRVLEVSLKKAGYVVTVVECARDALAIVAQNAPDLIISDTRFSDGQVDGFQFCERLKQSVEWSHIPFIFLTAHKNVEDKVRGLELGVDEYLTKPIFVKEILTRVRIVLQRKERTALEERAGKRTKFQGSLSDMAVVDLIQTIDISRKTGVIHFKSPEGERAAIYFRNGKVIDGELGRLVGEEAIYRLLTFSDGEFEVEFKQIRRRDTIDMSSGALLLEGVRRLDEWGRLTETLPPLKAVLEVDDLKLADRLVEIPDEVNALLRLFDGRRSLIQIIDDCDMGDLEALAVISKLCSEALVYDASERIVGEPPPASEAEEDWAQDDPTNEVDTAVVARLRAEAPRTELSPPAVESTPPAGAPRPPSADHHTASAAESDRPRPRSPVVTPSKAQEGPAAAGVTPSLATDSALAPAAAAPADSAVAAPHLTDGGEEEEIVARSRVGLYAAIGGLGTLGAIGLLWGLSGPPRPPLRPVVRLAMDASRVVDLAAPSSLVATSSPDAAVAAAVPRVDLGAPSALPDGGGGEAAYAELLREGRLLHERGRVAKAMQVLEQALQAKATGEEALIELANVLLEQGRLSKAALYAERACVVNPRNGKAQLVRGAVMQQYGKNREAHDAWELYLKLEPKGEFAREIRQILKTLR